MQTETRVPLFEEIQRRIETGEWAIIGLASCGTLPVPMLAWCFEEFGVPAHDLVLAVIVDKGVHPSADDGGEAAG